MDEYAPECPGCKTIYAKRSPPEAPPCETCIEPLLPENIDAGKIFLICRRQVIAAGPRGKIVDINHQAIKCSMDIYGIENQRECFEKVVSLFHATLSDDAGNAD
jgi:hypothetical protein